MKVDRAGVTQDFDDSIGKPVSNVKDITTNELLREILVEVKKINYQLSLVTGEVSSNAD